MCTCRGFHILPGQNVLHNADPKKCKAKVKKRRKVQHRHSHIDLILAVSRPTCKQHCVGSGGGIHINADKLHMLVTGYAMQVFSGCGKYTLIHLYTGRVYDGKTFGKG